MITPGVGGGFDGNLRFRKATTGSAVPVHARTPKKKKAQRGQTRGGNIYITAARPPQPVSIRKMLAGRKERTEGDDAVAVFCMVIF